MWQEELGTLTTFFLLITSQTRDFPACCISALTTTVPRAPIIIYFFLFLANLQSTLQTEQ
jgi:hypothetical protein